MTLAIVYSRAVCGISAPLVTVEVHLSNGLPCFSIVGLPETAVKESKHRVRSALMNTHFEFPTRHITVNLAPADLPKDSGRFDLPIALGILAASGQLSADNLLDYEFCGELALTGELRPIRGVLPIVIAAKQAGRQLIVPSENVQEASLVQQTKVYSAKHLLAVCAHLKDVTALLPCSLPSGNSLSSDYQLLDLQDVKGQAHAKRALEIAAAGRHSLLLVGPPGTGKSMLASRIPSILPPLNEEAALQVAAIASVSHGGFDVRSWRQVPFRSPHHTSSSMALVGGGRPPKPGEISLAHHGVLFLDELPEFSRTVLECLREPLESGNITISRAAFQMIFPARFQLIAAMNPCPCGYAGNGTEQCQCGADKIKRYLSKISGPLLDRIDMHVEVARLPVNMLAEIRKEAGVESALIRQRVIEAHTLQHLRQYKLNAALTPADLPLFCQLHQEAQTLLLNAANKFNLSARAYHRIIKVARTIADLSASKDIFAEHISEALNFRSLSNRMDKYLFRH